MNIAADFYTKLLPPPSPRATGRTIWFNDFKVWIMGMCNEAKYTKCKDGEQKCKFDNILSPCKRWFVEAEDDD